MREIENFIVFMYYFLVSKSLNIKYLGLHTYILNLQFSVKQLSYILLV